MQHFSFVESISEHLKRLGARTGDPVAFTQIMEGTSWVDLVTYESWEGEDPKDALRKVSPFVSRFLGIQWPDNFEMNNDEEEYTEIEFCSTNENYDTVIDSQRTLLYVIAYLPDSQYFRCIDLLEESNNPKVYSIDHDGDGPYVCCDTVSEFLSLLRLQE